MSLSRVLAGGQITLPREVRQRAGIKPGHLLSVEVIGQGEIRCSVLPDLSPRELRDRYPINVEIDETRDRPAWEAVAAGDF